MKNQEKTKELLLNAIPLWEVIIVFFVMVLLLLVVTKYVIDPLTIGNVVMQTQLTVFVLLVFLLLEYLFHFKRSKPMNLKINEIQNILSFKLLNKQINLVDIKNIDVVKFISKKSMSYTLIINKEMYLVYKKEAMIGRLLKAEISLFHNDVNTIKGIIEKNNLNDKSSLKYIPKAINVGFYSIIIIAFLLGSFLFTAIFTDNTQWLDYLEF